MNLPDSWIEARLADVCVLNPRLPTDARPDEMTEVTFVPMSAVDEKSGTISKPEVRTYREVLKGYTSFLENDVLFAKVTPCMENGKAAIAGSLANGLGFGSTEFHVLRPTELVLPEYIFHFIRQEAFRDRAASAFVGTGGLQRVPPEFLSRIKLPLPSLPEQQRIVDVLKQAVSVEELRDEAESIIERLAKQRFAEMFGHPAENTKGFETSLFRYFGTLDRGISKYRPRDASHLFGGRYPFIQTGDVSNAGDWITAYKSTYSEAGLAQSRLWPKGTLCITIAANIAKAAILEFDACFPDSVVGFTPNDDVCSEYVLYCLRFYQEYFEHRAPKSAQMNINLDTLRTLRMPKPPKALQQQFAAFVQEIRGLKNMLLKQTEGHSALVSELRVAAFTGELTEAWRTEHQNEIHEATTKREESLRVTIKKPDVLLSLPITEESIEKHAQGKSRHALLNQLSELQGFVRLAIIERKTLLLADNSAEFDEFCRMWPLEHLSGDRDRIRRALDQLAIFGLIAKVSLQNSQGLFVNAYRCFAEGEDRRVNDVIELRKQLLRLTDLETGQEELN